MQDRRAKEDDIGALRVHPRDPAALGQGRRPDEPDGRFDLVDRDDGVPLLVAPLPLSRRARCADIGERFVVRASEDQIEVRLLQALDAPQRSVPDELLQQGVALVVDGGLFVREERRCSTAGCTRASGSRDTSIQTVADDEFRAAAADVDEGVPAPEVDAARV